MYVYVGSLCGVFGVFGRGEGMAILMLDGIGALMVPVDRYIRMCIQSRD